MNPRVSVLIPCYNTAEYVVETLDALFAQTYTSFEAVVVNDGSPDTEQLERVLAPYRDRLVYVVQENLGLSGARNTAVRHASGELVALLDSDDYWHPEYLETLVGELDRRPELDVVFPDALVFGDAVEAGRTMMQMSPPTGEITFDRLLAMECFVFVGVVARKQALEDAGLFDETFRSSEDYDLWLRLLHRGGRIGYVPKVLAYYRRRATSLSANLERMFEHHDKVWDKVERTLRLIPAQQEVLQSQRARTEAKRQLTRGRAAFFAGNFPEARERLAEANRTMRSRKLGLTVLAMAVAPRLLLGVFRLRDRFVYGANTQF